MWPIKEVLFSLGKLAEFSNESYLIMGDKMMTLKPIAKLFGVTALGLTLFMGGSQRSHAAVPYKNCSGGIAVNGLFDYLHKDKDGQMVLDKTLTNNSCESALYYIVKMYRAENPFSKGGKKEKDILLTPKAMAESILPNTRHIILAPKHKKSIHLIMPEGNKNKDLAFYRITFQPVLPEKKYGFNIDQKKLKALKAQASIGMGVSTALVVEPVNPKYTYTIKQKGSDVVIKNTGNALVFANFSGKCLVADNKENVSKGNTKAEVTKQTADKAKENKNNQVAKQVKNDNKVIKINCGDKSYASYEFRIYPNQSSKIDISAYKKQATVVIKKGYKQDKEYYTVSH